MTNEDRVLLVLLVGRIDRLLAEAAAIRRALEALLSRVTEEDGET